MPCDSLLSSQRAKQNSATNPVTEKAAHIPAPNFVPTQSLATVMKDVMAAQAQPWLVAPEARAPQVSANALQAPQQQQQQQQQKAPSAPPSTAPSPLAKPKVPAVPQLTEQDIAHMKRVSAALQRELKAKYDRAERWGRSAQNVGGSGQVNSHRNQRNPDAAFYQMIKSRARLPACQMKDEIVSTISSNQITVVSGDTGCGKTTQVPQLVLDDMIRQVRSRAGARSEATKRCEYHSVGEKLVSNAVRFAHRRGGGRKPTSS